MSEMISVSQMDVSTPDGIDAYLKFVYGQPLLTQEEEFDLASRHKLNNDLKAAEKLVLTHLKLVASIARSFHGYGIPQGDLLQEGTVGLMKAVKKFDPAVGVRLSTFAVHWIRSEILEYSMKNWDIVRVATSKAQRKLFFKLRGLNGEGGLSNNEIAEKLDVSVEEVNEMSKRLAGRSANFNSVDVDTEQQSWAAEDYMQDFSLEPLNVINKNTRDRLSSEGIWTAVKNLNSREREIIESRWLTDTPATLHDLGVQLGLSLERVRQIEKKALVTMKKHIPEELAECF